MLLVLSLLAADSVLPRSSPDYARVSSWISFGDSLEQWTVGAPPNTLKPRATSTFGANGLAGITVCDGYVSEIMVMFEFVTPSTSSRMPIYNRGPDPSQL